ncbi:MAG: TVP38/TMEM64 family protein [Rhodospirillales bacterium]
MNPRIFLRAGVLFASLIVIGILIKEWGLAGLFDEGWIDTHIRGHGLSGHALFIAAGALFTAVGLPRQMVAFFGGYAFGLLDGTLAALAAATLGCTASFLYARILGRSLVQHRFPGRVRKIDTFLAGNPFTMTLLIRFLPVGSNLATNLAAGVSSASAVAFLAGSAIGYLPQTLVFALVGSGVDVGANLRIGLGILLFVVSAGLGAYLYRRYRHGRSLGDEVDSQLQPSPGEEVHEGEETPASKS